MSTSESNSIGCSQLIDLKGCKELNKTNKKIQYSIDFTNDPKILFTDAIGNKKEMRFKRSCTVTITSEKIFYNRDDVIIKPA